METYKIILVGDSTVGKTNLLTQYVDEKFTEENISTVGIEFKNKIIQLKNGNKFRLQIWDTNKIDLGKREVSREEAENFAKENNLQYFEISVKENKDNQINNMFVHIVESFGFNDIVFNEEQSSSTNLIGQGKRRGNKIVNNNQENNRGCCN